MHDPLLERSRRRPELLDVLADRLVTAGLGAAIGAARACGSDARRELAVDRTLGLGLRVRHPIRGLGVLADARHRRTAFRISSFSRQRSPFASHIRKRSRRFSRSIWPAENLL